MAVTKFKPSESTSIFRDFQELLKLWIKFRAALIKAIQTDPITQEEEEAFRTTKSLIAKYLRGLGQRTGDVIYYGEEQITEMIRTAISINHLRGLPVMDKEIMYQNWHKVYVFLSRAVGAFRFMGDGYVPRLSHVKEAATTIAGVKAGASGRDKRDRVERIKQKIKTTLTLVITLGIIIAALVLLIRRFGQFQ